MTVKSNFIVDLRVDLCNPEAGNSGGLNVSGPFSWFKFVGQIGRLAKTPNEKLVQAVGQCRARGNIEKCKTQMQISETGVLGIDAGVNPEHPVDSAPLFMPLVLDDKFCCLEALLNVGANPDIKAKAVGIAFLCMLIESISGAPKKDKDKLRELAIRIIRSGRVNLKDCKGEDGMGVIHYAIISKELDILKALVASRPHLATNSRDDRRRPPLMVALMQEHFDPDVLSFLLSIPAVQNSLNQEQESGGYFFDHLVEDIKCRELSNTQVFKSIVNLLLNNGLKVTWALPDTDPEKGYGGSLAMSILSGGAGRPSFNSKNFSKQFNPLVILRNILELLTPQQGHRLCSHETQFAVQGNGGLGEYLIAAAPAGYSSARKSSARKSSAGKSSAGKSECTVLVNQILRGVNLFHLIAYLSTKYEEDTIELFTKFFNKLGFQKVQPLLQAGADINRMNYSLGSVLSSIRGITPLEIASERGSVEVVKFLIGYCMENKMDMAETILVILARRRSGRLDDAIIEALLPQILITDYNANSGTATEAHHDKIVGLLRAISNNVGSLDVFSEHLTKLLRADFKFQVLLFLSYSIRADNAGIARLEKFISDNVPEMKPHIAILKACFERFGKGAINHSEAKLLLVLLHEIHAYVASITKAHSDLAKSSIERNPALDAFVSKVIQALEGEGSRASEERPSMQSIVEIVRNSMYAKGASPKMVAAAPSSSVVTVKANSPSAAPASVAKAKAGAGLPALLLEPIAQPERQKVTWDNVLSNEGLINSWGVIDEKRLDKYINTFIESSKITDSGSKLGILLSNVVAGRYTDKTSTQCSISKSGQALKSQKLKHASSHAKIKGKGKKVDRDSRTLFWDDSGKLIFIAQHVAVKSGAKPKYKILSAHPDPKYQTYVGAEIEF